MYFVYSIITYLVFILSPIIFFFRIINGKEDPKRFREKFCIYHKKNNLNSIWFHAVSVGEIMSIIPILKKIEKNKKIQQIIVTSSTKSSAKIFETQKFKKTIHKYYPLDTNYLNLKFINFWKPKAAFFVDSEIWPNMIKNLHKQKIPIIILNARITKKSFQKWMIINNFSKSIFKKISLALASDIQTKKFLKKLGVKKIIFAGNLKYYGMNNKKNLDTKLYKYKFKNFKILCAASTHHGEEKLISKLHKIIKRKEKNLLTIIIPRHIERIPKIMDDLRKNNLKVITHSSNKNLKENTDIYLVDTYGEASKFYNLSNITFVGGSIVKHGGQNPLEPARLGNHIVNGPHITNFREIYKFLLKNKISITSSNIISIKNFVEKKIDKKISNKNKKKIFNIGKKILNNNMYYLNKYIL